ncbi:hypothetical protein SF301_0741 [Shigella flexneri 2a str. 301]|uniref:Uncharacterized protein n=1 Tax=Shigella flexneri 2a str. 301 TaxID=198214 RepID=A0AB36PFF0_SHIFL|nr:hypothetical protein SF2457T_0585 [Shigella flexneri 2a str. 2457T]OXB28586.1 hypothetical protein SF301_0741 [Shigella flexneri 2a str. 301]
MFDEWVFDFHDLHTLSPLRGSHKKIDGLYLLSSGRQYYFR